MTRLIGIILLLTGLTCGVLTGAAEDGDGDDSRAPVPPITSEAAGGV